ncbi:putative sorcin-like isoform 2 [Capsicum annuum]|nr:putative sorcin-like isoform 2 [Capsicum annuum]
MENLGILREWFDRVDTDKIGSITAIQLKNAFAIGNLQFPITVVQQMIRMCDFDHNGTMSFQEFVQLNKFLLKALIKIGFRLDSPALYTVCESFDRDKNGKFRLDDFISLCIFVQSARNLFDSFDTAKQGRVTLDLNQFIYCMVQYVGLPKYRIVSLANGNFHHPYPRHICMAFLPLCCDKRRNNRKENDCHGNLPIVESEVIVSNIQSPIAVSV